MDTTCKVQSRHVCITEVESTSLYWDRWRRALDAAREQAVRGQCWLGQEAGLQSGMLDHLPPRSTLVRSLMTTSCSNCSPRRGAPPCHLVLLQVPRIPRRRSPNRPEVERHQRHARQGSLRPRTLAAGRRREIPERPARAPQRRPDPMALQGPSKRLDRPAPGRRRPACSATAGRDQEPDEPRRSGRRRRHRLHAGVRGEASLPPNGCSRSCASAYGSEWSDVDAGQAAGRVPGARPARHSTTGSATSSSSSTASGSTTARSSGTSGTVARTASQPW